MLLVLKDNSSTINLLISLFVQAEILNLTLKSSETIQACKHLSGLIFNTQKKIYKSRIVRNIVYFCFAWLFLYETIQINHLAGILIIFCKKLDIIGRSCSLDPFSGSRVFKG